MSRECKKEITCCNNCPYCATAKIEFLGTWNPDMSTKICMGGVYFRELKPHDVDGSFELPDWCPLPEAEEKSV